MTFALVQTSLEIPPTDALKRAFRSVQSLTDHDAHVLAADAFGILVKNLPGNEAATVQQALRAEGIETEIIPQAQLPQIPPGKFVRRIQCTAESLLVHDALGRPFPVEWRHLSMIAAGKVRVQEFNRVRNERKVTRYTAEGYAYTDTEVDYSSREQSNFQHLMEIFVGRNALRYSIQADKPFLFQHLGERFNPDLDQSVALVVRELAQFAPHAAINRGTHYLREGAGPFSYPSKNAFTEELIWLLWRLQRLEDARGSQAGTIQ